MLDEINVAPPRKTMLCELMAEEDTCLDQATFETSPGSIGFIKTRNSFNCEYDGYIQERLYKIVEAIKKDVKLIQSFLQGDLKVQNYERHTGRLTIMAHMMDWMQYECSHGANLALRRGECLQQITTSINLLDGMKGLLRARGKGTWHDSRRHIDFEDDLEVETDTKGRGNVELSRFLMPREYNLLGDGLSDE